MSDYKSAADKTVESSDKAHDSRLPAEGLIQKKDHLKYWIAGVVSLMTFIVYLASLRNGFVLWDDDWYIFENPHIRSLDLTFFKWAFLDFYSGNWHPLTWISHAMDYAVWGLNPLGHHLTNNILHAVNTFLVVLLTIRLAEIYGERARVDGTSILPDERKILILGGVTGLLFGLHPLHVESVAWVSERKDLLCALFYLISVKTYLEYANPMGIATEDQGQSLRYFNKQYLLVVGFFILALLSKPMAITLPAVLLVLDWYPLSRIKSFKSFRNVLIEKIPFVVLGLISSVLTIFAQKAGGALSVVVMVFEPFSARSVLAAKSLLSYLWKMILPIDLIPLYPYPANIAPLSSEYIVPVVFVIAITVICAIFVKKQKLWLAVWGYFIITLLPVLGIVPVGIQSMADRYTYLPSIGPFLIVGLLASWISERVAAVRKMEFIAKGGSIAVALLVAVSMTYLTFAQIGIWRNSIALWSYVIEMEPASVPTAYGNRGVSFAELGDLGKALDDYDMAIRLDPFYTGIYYERGLVLAKMHQFEKAISDYDKAIALDQYGAKSNVGREVFFLNRGLAHLETAQPGLAVSDLKQACEMGSNRGCEILESYTSTGAKPEM